MILSGCSVCRKAEPLCPSCPPDFLPDFVRKLTETLGFFNPSVDGGWLLFPLFIPSRRFSSATSCCSAAMVAACARMIAYSSSSVTGFSVLLRTQRAVISPARGEPPANSLENPQPRKSVPKGSFVSAFQILPCHCLPFRRPVNHSLVNFH